MGHSVYSFICMKVLLTDTSRPSQIEMKNEIYNFKKEMILNCKHHLSRLFSKFGKWMKKMKWVGTLCIENNNSMVKFSLY